MTQLAVAAGKSLPDFHLEPEDLPAPSGFIVFAEPIGSYVTEAAGASARIPIVALTWGPCDYFGFPRGGIWFTYYSPSDVDADARTFARVSGRPMREKERARLRASRGPLTWDNESAVGFGADVKAQYAPGASHNGDPDSTRPGPRLCGRPGC